MKKVILITDKELSEIVDKIDEIESSAYYMLDKYDFVQIHNLFKELREMLNKESAL